MSSGISPSQVGAYVAVGLTIFLSSTFFKWISKGTLGDEPRKKKIYGLHHAILNINVPPKTMWMNMGYWERDSDLPKACSRLLKEVLKAADLIDEDGYRTGRWPIKLVDLGFGCGDQTIEIAKNYPTLASSYIGLTIDPKQYNFARQRLSSLQLPQDPSLTTDTPSNHPDQEEQAKLDKYSNHQTDLLQQRLENHAKEVNGAEKSINLFCADAAQPAKWTNELKEAITPNLAKQLRENSQKPSLSILRKQETWILGLDTLYHFSPSRQPIFNHVYQKLQASIMAFDLIFGDGTTLVERTCMRIIALIMGCPMGNFVTAIEYREQLLMAGYEEDKIEINDISECVFKGLADYLKKRDEELQVYLGRGLGAYKVFGWVLRWWSRSGIVRGCIIVAKI
ncbi:hypothetical protein JMJ35_009058 [Cladonia borealis]|uniref:Methyltransferase domain-containing protein n=1 Tax=Cladonia borealis TaxID=184061 RepID=A0AA39UYP7_9LECA|nr:hypothetical protein JMJ35_009058 [Cladonia borealis]